MGTLAILPQTSIRLVDGGPRVFARMLAVIAAAERFVHLEVYAWSRTGIGAQFITALSQAAHRGVRVRVELDAWGTGLASTRIAGRLRQAGCEVHIFNPLLAGFLGRFGRNHRKLLLVDDRIAFVGGINLSDEFLGRHGWQDLAVEIHGLACAELGHRLRREPHGPADPLVRILLSGLSGGRRLRKRYVKAFGAAHTRILVAHSYFLPDRKLLRSLTAAARRGVSVTLLVPGHSDVPLARWATALLYRRLLSAGVELYEWTDSVLHAKLAVVDGERMLVGSFNLDPYSLANLEALVESHDREAARSAESWILRRLGSARRITAADRPLRWLERLLGLLGRALANWIRWLLARR